MVKLDKKNLTDICKEIIPYIALAGAMITPLASQANNKTPKHSAPETTYIQQAPKTTPEWIPVTQNGRLDEQKLIQRFNEHMDKHEPAYREFYQKLAGLDISDKNNDKTVSNALDSLFKTVFNTNENKSFNKAVQVYAKNDAKSLLKLGKTEKNQTAFGVLGLCSLVCYLLACETGVLTMAKAMTPYLKHRGKKTITESLKLLGTTIALFTAASTLAITGAYMSHSNPVLALFDRKTIQNNFVQVVSHIHQKTTEGKTPDYNVISKIKQPYYYR